MMRKNYFLWFLLMIFGSFSIVNAQTKYSLNDLSIADFEAGGNTLWSFEKYEVVSGTYSSFTTFGEDGRVNFFDRYNPERYGSYPIMQNPETLTDPYPVKRKSWYNSAEEYLYVARDYPEGTSFLGLEYEKSIPKELMGYEVYSSQSGPGESYCNSAITFTVPNDGYYKVDMTVLREDNVRTDPMTIIQRYRYTGKNQVSDVIRLNQSFTYGAGGDVTGTAELPTAPESEAVGAVRYAAQKPVSKFFYIYAKAGDKISFETDSRSTNNPETAVRGVWARTKWTNLTLTVTDETTAKSDLNVFVDPYKEDPSAFTELDKLLTYTEDLINESGTNYPKVAKDALQREYVRIDEAYNNIHAMEVIGFIDQLQKAIDTFLASAYGLKVRYIFDNVTDNIVKDASDNGYDGKLLNQASIETMGKYKVLNLGNGSGYLDMGEAIGTVISSMESYTISAYFRINEDEALSGNGHFLWMFSSQAENSAGAGEYIYYRVPNNRNVITKAGWNNEKAIQPAGLNAEKGKWQHVVFRQTENKSEIFINGELKDVVTDSLFIPLGNFTLPTVCNWIGRPAFKNDNYLKNTLVYDFCLHNLSVTDEKIAEWAGLLPDLENEMLNGTGDFSELLALISEYKVILANSKIGDEIGKYPEISKQEFNDAITIAEEFVKAGKGSQIIINEKIKLLQAAYNVFVASKNSAMVYPGSDPVFQSGIYYIQVGDYFLTMPENGANNTYLELRPYIDNLEKLNNNQVWNIQYNTTFSNLDGERPYALFSIVSDKEIWTGDGNWHMDENGRMKEGGTSVAQSDAGSNWTWREHMIFFDGTAYNIVNHYYWNRNDACCLVFPNETENEKASRVKEMKFQFRFRTVEDVVSNVSIEKISKSDKAIIYGANAEIIISGANIGDVISIYDISGRLIKTTKVGSDRFHVQINSGLYIVRTGDIVNKVIVR